MTDLRGKNALLTGGSRGIGPFIAEMLADHGCNMALAARTATDLQSVASKLIDRGVKISSFPVDLARSADRRTLMAAVVEQFGQIDILINNAGLETAGAFLDLPWEAFEQTLQVNLAAPIELTHLALPDMLKRKSGHIVNIASGAAKNGLPYEAVYSGTKAGLAEWTRGLRLEFAQSGVQFSTIFPGYVTGVGMFASFGIDVPGKFGSCTPEQVAQATIKAIQRNLREVIVNSRPSRLAFVANEVSAELGDWYMLSSGVVEYQRKKVIEKR
jgi:short-subunit dehydrogenase